MFQVGGAGAVGTGSLRGMPLLQRLHDEEFSIWPFDPPGWPRVVEIYPRLLTGAANKGRRDKRVDYLQVRAGIPAPLRDLAIESEDAFDAAVSAIVMSENIERLTNLPYPLDAQRQIEGVIWHPTLSLTSGS